MNEIITLIGCLAPYIAATTLRQMEQIIPAMLSMTGRVTMIGLARWTESGGSYRTIQGWYQRPLVWAELMWVIVRSYLLNETGRYVLAGDEVEVSKAGASTDGLGRFYSSLAGRAIPSVSFLAVWRIDVEGRHSDPLQVEQRLPSEGIGSPTLPQRGRARPKGSKNHTKAVPTLSPELRLLQQMLKAVIERLAPLQSGHVVLDGFFGTYPATYMVQQTGLHLVSKLRHNAALYLPYTGPKPARGPTPRYGEKLN
jgi:putative transposase